jgi:hypothetical protein
LGGDSNAPNIDYSSFDFSSLDLPQWGGAYSAPMTGGQLDAMQGFNVLAQNNPLAQVFNQMGATGASIQDMGSMFRPAGEGYGNLSNIVQGGPMGGVPQFSDMSQLNNMMSSLGQSSMGNTSNFGYPMQLIGNAMNWTIPNFGDHVVNTAGNLYNTDVVNSNTNPAVNSINAAVNTASTSSANVDPVTGFISGILGSAPSANHGTSQNFLEQLFASGGQTPGTSQLTNTLTGQLNNVFNDRFDLTPMFTEAENTFQSSLDRNLARVREEYSGLGIAPGSSDRIDALGRTVGDATSQFKLGLQDVARQSFESAADRRLGGINTGMNLSNLTQLPQNTLLSALPALMQSESLPMQEQLAARQQQLGALPTMLDALRTNPELAQGASSLLLQAGGIQGQLAQIPFQEQMAELSQKYGALPAILGGQQLGLQSTQANIDRMLSGAGLYGDLASRNTGERQTGIQNMMSMLPMMFETGTLPFNQAMQSYQNIYNPYGDRALGASMGLMGADQQAQTAAMNALNQQAGLYGQQYGLNEASRGLADADLQRAMAEFARTQGGTLNQALSLFGMPGLNTGFGPSQLAQYGNMLGGIAGIAGAGMDLYDLFSGGRR